MASVFKIKVIPHLLVLDVNYCKYLRTLSEPQGPGLFFRVVEICVNYRDIIRFE